MNFAKKILKSIGIAFLIGFVLEFIFLNFWMYNSKINIFLFGVPLFIVFLWSLLLPVSYALRELLVKIIKPSNKLVFDLILFVLLIIPIEYIGSNVLGVFFATEFPSLIPACNCMKAPLWLYVVYFIVMEIYFKIMESD